MFGSDIIEVAIGMAFLFLFMSMIASALREAFEAYVKHRAVDLERGITEMLRTGDGSQWVANLYNHPLISSLYRGQYKEQTAGQDKTQAQSANEKPAEGQGKAAKLPSYIPKESFALAILDLAAKASEAGEPLSVERLKEQLKTHTPNAVQRVVLTALSVAGDDLAGVRKYLEDWYDSAMDRVTGWYARRTALFLFVIGFGAAAVLNVDAITITKRLITDRPLRQSIVAQAEKYTQAPGVSPKSSFDDLRSEFSEIGYPIGWTSSGHWLYPAPQACHLRPPKAVPADPHAADAVPADPHAADGGDVAYVCDASVSYPAAWLLALMGWLVTAIAIMLGAPFWFDLLNKLVSLRSALKPPENNPGKKKVKQAAPPPGPS